MSLLKNIRRRHKGFDLKRLVHTHVGRNRPVSVFIESDTRGEEESEDEDREYRIGAVQKVYSQCTDSLNHEAGHMPPLLNPFSSDNEPASSCAITKLYSSKEDIGKKCRVWPYLTKTAAFLLVAAGAFSVGKVAAIGITLAAAICSKIFVRRDCTGTRRLVSDEAGDQCCSNGSLPSSLHVVRQDRVPSLADISNIKSMSLIGDVIVDENSVKDPQFTSHAQIMDLLGDGHGSSESAGLNVNEHIFLPQRKKLKRLDCIKLPNTSLFDEEGDHSPFLSATPSPQTWFQSGGSSQQEYTTTGSTNMNKHFKEKSKALLRRLRKKESQSLTFSQLKQTDEACHDFSDGSETERSPHSTTSSSQSTSRFKPGSREGSSLRNFDTLRGQKKQPIVMTDELAQRRHASLTPGNSTCPGADAAIKDEALHEAFFKREKGRKPNHARIGPPWIVSGLIVTMIGLLRGRIPAIAGLICYWYMLSARQSGAAIIR